MITQWVLSPITCIFIRKFGNMCPYKSKSEGERRGRENVATYADVDMWPQAMECLHEQKLQENEFSSRASKETVMLPTP